MMTQIAEGLQKYIPYEVLLITFCGTMVWVVLSYLGFWKLAKMAREDFDNRMNLQAQSWNMFNESFSSAAEVIKMDLRDTCWYHLKVLTTALLALAKEKLQDQYEVGCLTTIWQQMVEGGSLPYKNNLVRFIERFMDVTKKSPDLQLYECVKSVYDCLRDAHDIIGYPIDSQDIEKLLGLKEAAVQKISALKEVNKKIIKSISDEKKKTENQ